MKSMAQISITILCFLLLTSCKKDGNPTRQFTINTDTYLNYPQFVRSGLIAYYPFNGNADDYSGNRNHGLVHGATPSVDRFGNPNRAYSFNGIDHFIEIPNSDDFNGNEYTICFWTRTAISHDESIRSVLSKSDSACNGYTIDLSHLGSYGLRLKSPNPKIDSWAELLRSIGEGQTYEFISIIFNTEQVKAYHQGFHVPMITYTPTYLSNNNNFPLYIGKSLSPFYMNFKGEIDDVMIYNRVLSDREIMALYRWK